MDSNNGHNVIYSYDQADKVLVAVDCIIFGFDEEDLKILLVKRGIEPEKGKWSLVGGLLKKEETLEAAAIRILDFYTGLDDIFMEQVATFGALGRDPVERTISTVYYALINIHQHSNNLFKEYSAKWFSVSNYPKLIFDHEEMVQHALNRLRLRTTTEPIGFDLLPEKFTMRQLQKLYEAIWDTQLDKRNFINKINSLDILEKLEEKDMTTSRKGSFLYKFDVEKYRQQTGKSFELNL